MLIILFSIISLFVKSCGVFIKIIKLDNCWLYTIVVVVLELHGPSTLFNVISSAVS